MTDLTISLSSGGGKVLSRDSTAKWVLLALVAITDLVWMSYVGLRTAPGFLYALVGIFVLIFISLFYFYAGREQRIMEFAHFGAQLLSLYAVTMILTYLAVSTDAPLADDALDAIDKSLGLDWVAWTKWMRVHPYISSVLFFVYHSLPIQGSFCYIYNIHTRQFWRNSEIWWITFITLLVTIAGTAAFPATNPYVYYGLVQANHFVHMGLFSGLRDGTLHVVSVAMHEGLIQAPSFHTILAIMVTYNLRHNRRFFAIAVVLNATLILSCVSVGSHYFVDLIAGAAVAAITILAVRRFQLNGN